MLDSQIPLEENIHFEIIHDFQTLVAIQELSQDSVARLTSALPLNLSKSMTLDLKVTQVSPGDIA